MPDPIRFIPLVENVPTLSPSFSTPPYRYIVIVLLHQVHQATSGVVQRPALTGLSPAQVPPFLSSTYRCRPHTHSALHSVHRVAGSLTWPRLCIDTLGRVPSIEHWDSVQSRTGIQLRVFLESLICAGSAAFATSVLRRLTDIGRPCTSLDRPAHLERGSPCVLLG